MLFSTPILHFFGLNPRRIRCGLGGPDLPTEKVAAERSLSTKKDKGAMARQLWAPETNPFSSRLERKTASALKGRKYFENGVWQAWLLGL